MRERREEGGEKNINKTNHLASFMLTKASYVQDSYVVTGALKRKALIDSLHNEIKETDVESLCQGITSLAGLLGLQRDTGREEGGRYKGVGQIDHRRS